MGAKWDRIWMSFLWRLDEWMCARLQAAIRRNKLRLLKRQLERGGGWRN